MKTRKTILAGIAILMLAVAAAADVRVESTSLQPSHIQPGDEVDVHIKVYKAVEKIDVYGGTERQGSKGVVKDDPSVFYIAEITAKDAATKDYITILDGEKKLGHLFYGETWTTPMKIRVRSDAPPADYTLEYRLIKTDSTYSTTDDVKSADITIPVEGLVKFSIESDSSLSLGATGSVDVKLTNVGGGNARQVSVNLNASNPFTILSSSEAYAGNMVGVVAKDLSYSISVASTATPGAHEIPVLITYVNSTGSEVTVKRTLGVEVAGTPDISVMLDKADTLKAGGKAAVSLTVINNGFIDAKFLNLKLVSTGSYTVSEPSEIYIGNLASDDFESQEFEIQVAEAASAGALPLRAIVEYRKENSNTVERVEQTVNVNVLSDSEYAKTVKGNGGGRSIIGVILAIPALIVAYIVLWLVFKLVGLITNHLNRRLFKKGAGQ